MSNTPSHLTIVYTINDPTSFVDECEKIISQLKESANGLTTDSWNITAISNDDEIHRLELIEAAIETGDLAAVSDVLSHPCIGNISSLTEMYSHEAITH